MGEKKYKIKHNRSTLRINFVKSVPVMVYVKGKLKAQSYHRMRVSFETKLVEVGIDMMGSRRGKRIS